MAAVADRRADHRAALQHIEFALDNRAADHATDPDASATPARNSHVKCMAAILDQQEAARLDDRAAVGTVRLDLLLAARQDQSVDDEAAVDHHQRATALDVHAAARLAQA